MSRNKALSFLTAVFFIGILLSITLYLGLSGFFGPSSADGQGRQALFFNQAFREDDAIQTFVRYCDYKLFRHIDQDSIIIGESDWLFDTTREDNGYDYLLDYVGGCPYSEEQLARMARWISTRREECADRDADYLLVVIPNSMTAVSDRLPTYIGGQSENTRLKQLGRYLEERGETAFLDLSDTMRVGRDQEALYNNTEDSINAYGAYALYDTVMSELSARGRAVDGNRMNAESIQFFTHNTDGKSTARRMGLERLVSNRTVSLSETMADLYRTSEVTVQCVTTTMTEGATGSKEKLVIECSTEWDKIQTMPFFSNTFETVVYENTIHDSASSLDHHHGTVLIQVIHESELELLLK